MAIEMFGFDKVLGEAKNHNKATLDKIVLRELKLIAEEACNHARNDYPTRASGGYDDHTKNLRGSIGYKIFFNGTEITHGGLDGKGSEKGEQVASSTLNRIQSDGKLWEIVVVAGMEYARYVEAKGYNVISFVQAFLDKEIEKLKKAIKDGEL